MKKRTLVIILVVLLVISVFPTGALAVGETITTSQTYNLTAVNNSNTLDIDPGLEVTLTNTGNLILTDSKITCGAGVKLTINSVEIDNTGFSKSAILFTGAGNELKLEGTSTLLGSAYQAGIQVDAGSELTISGAGTLNVSCSGEEGDGRGCERER